MMKVKATPCQMADTGVENFRGSTARNRGMEEKMERPTLIGGVAVVVVILMFSTTGIALAHCDTLDGPVITQARLALEKGDVKIVLPWVAADKEEEIREAFELTLAVRGKGETEKTLADRYFFETLVRVHREGEGAPYTGLKPARLDLGPAIPAADKALESGDPKPLLALIEEKIHEGIRSYYVEAMEKREHAGESVEAGRAYVEAYVPYVHFVERLYTDATRPIAHGAGEVEIAGNGHPGRAEAGEHVH